MKNKNVVVCIVIILIVLLKIILTDYLLISGSIPFRFKEDMIIFMAYEYYPFLLYRKIKRPRIRLVNNIPNKLFYLHEGKLDINYPVSEFAEEPIYYEFDYDCHLLFLAGNKCVFNRINKYNESNILSEEEYYSVSNDPSLRDKIQRLAIFRIGDLSNRAYPSYLFIKLYNNGEAFINYIWIDVSINKKMKEMNIKRITAQIPQKKELVIHFLNKMTTLKMNVNDYYTIDTERDIPFVKGIYGTDGDNLIIIKKENNIKMIFRDPGMNKRRNDLNDLWIEVIEAMRLKENISEIVTRDKNVSEPLHLKLIKRDLSIFCSNE